MDSCRFSAHDWTKSMQMFGFYKRLGRCQLPKDWELPSGHEVVWHPAEKATRVSPPFLVLMEEILRPILN